MAKQRKRSKRTSSARNRRASVQASAQAVAPEPQKSTQEIFSEEYHYVVSDLKRFGALAVGMFALLVALALIIG